MAPGFTDEALSVFKGKPNLRLLKIALPAGGATAWEQGRNAIDVKRVGSGLLMQTADNRELVLADLKVVTRLQPTAAQLQDLLFAWKVAKYVKSTRGEFSWHGQCVWLVVGRASCTDMGATITSASRTPGIGWRDPLFYQTCRLGKRD